jgi:hypothetical protein
LEGGLTTTPPQSCPQLWANQLGVVRSTARLHTLLLLSGRSGLGMFVAFEHGVMYFLSFATMAAVVATAAALVVLLVMIVGRSVWRLFRS